MSDAHEGHEHPEDSGETNSYLTNWEQERAVYEETSRDLEAEQAAHQRTQDALRAEQSRARRLEEELRRLRGED